MRTCKPYSPAIIQEHRSRCIICSLREFKSGPGYESGFHAGWGARGHLKRAPWTGQAWMHQGQVAKGIWLDGHLHASIVATLNARMNAYIVWLGRVASVRCTKDSLDTINKFQAPKPFSNSPRHIVTSRTTSQAGSNRFGSSIMTL